jgi:hypothetical protein
MRPATAPAPALTLALALACTSCQFGDELKTMNDLVVAMQAKYDRPVNLSLSTNGHLTIRLTQPSPIDTLKFSQATCSDYASDVARFAIRHYAHPDKLSDVRVTVAQVSDFGPAHFTREYCSGEATPNALQPDTAPPR